MEIKKLQRTTAELHIQEKVLCGAGKGRKVNGQNFRDKEEKK